MDVAWTLPSSCLSLSLSFAVRDDLAFLALGSPFLELRVLFLEVPTVPDPVVGVEGAAAVALVVSARDTSPDVRMGQRMEDKRVRSRA